MSEQEDYSYEDCFGEKRVRAYTRYQRFRAIHRKKGLCERAFRLDWFCGVDGKYSKGQIGCGCGLCKPTKRFRYPSETDARKASKYARDLKDFWNGEY